MPFNNKSLGEALVEEGLITSHQLTEIYDKYKLSEESFCRLIVDNLYVDELKLAIFLGQFLDLPLINLVNRKIDRTVLSKIPVELARKYLVLPLYHVMDTITVAMADPMDFQAIEEIEFITKCRVEPVIATVSEISSSLDRYFGTFSSIKTIVDKLEKADPESEFETIEDVTKIFDVEETAGPIHKLLHLILSHAVRERASDIHIEPKQTGLLVRFRIDGVLHKVMSLPLNLSSSLVSSIKILSKMDIAEKRAPLDGGFQARIDGRVMDLRVASFPMLYGEKLAIRLLDQEGILFNLEDLGMSKELLEQIKTIIKKPYGLFLVTGPTGSGKTTTLYSILNEIKSIEKNIVTIEDPIEYHLEMINQSQVNPKAGLNYANALRSFLRQDPDVILVGEIRDSETAKMAFQAALTGHLVFATLHTNDAASSIVRLVDMGVDPLLITSSIVGVLAQRLARRICSSCKTVYKPSEAVLSWAKDEGLKVNQKGVVNLTQKSLKIATPERTEFYHGSGCKACRGTGYKGRVGLFEFLVFDEELRKLINSGQISEFEIRHALNKGEMITLKDDGLIKVRKQISSVDEVMRLVK